MAMSIDTVAEQAQDIAARLGIPKYDVFGAVVDETSAQVDHGDPKQVKASSRSGVTVRVWNDDGTVGVTSTSDVDPLGLEMALKTAYDASLFGAKENIPGFSPEATMAIDHTPHDKAPQAPVSELIERLVAAESTLMKAHPAIAAVPYNGMAQRHIDRFYLNSEGARRQEGHSVASIYLYSKTEQEGKKPRSAGAFRVSRGLDELDIDGCVAETAEKTISHLGYQKVKSGKYPVVFSPDAFLSLVGAFSNLFNAQNVLDKQSLSTAESIGQAIASPLLSLCDDALHPENVGGESFDGEGTPTRRLTLIDQGVLTNFMHSAGTAQRLGAQPTGHANMGAKVSVGRHFLHAFSAAPAEREYSLADADGVIFIDDLQALHAGVQSLQGSFSLPFDGWLIENGKRTSIESATVAGDILKVLQSILYVEKELELVGGGIAPRVWVDALSITGE